MPEVLITTLAVAFCVIVLLGCVSAAACVILLYQISGVLAALNKAVGSVRAGQKRAAECQERAEAVFVELKEGLAAQAVAHEKIAEADGRMSEFLLKMAQAIDSLRAGVKEGFDAQVQNDEKVIDAAVQISNKNSKTLMDVQVTLAQMLELVLKGMGYTPSRPTGLMDPPEQPKL